MPVAHITTSVLPFPCRGTLSLTIEILKQQDQQLAALFDNARRSNAVSRLLAMRAAGLVNDQEYAQFTVKLREALAKLTCGAVTS